MNEAKLVLYDEMRLAIERCAQIDEAATIRTTAAKLAAYARIRDDSDSERQFAEIRLRAIRKIGEISRDLETGHKIGRGQGKIQVPIDGKLKEQTLQEAGISTSAANRYEQLAGPREVQAQQAANAAADLYFAEQHAHKEPITFNGLKTAVQTALVETLGEPPKSKAKAKEEVDHRFIRFIGPIRHFWRNRADYDPVFFADEEMDFMIEGDLEACEAFISLVKQFSQEVNKRFQ